jgi:hypothetical protein
MGGARIKNGGSRDERATERRLDNTTMTILITFILTTTVWGALAAFALRRVAMHLKENPEGIEAISKHVLLPILGRRNESKKAEGA